MIKSNYIKSRLHPYAVENALLYGEYILKSNLFKSKNFISFSFSNFKFSDSLNNDYNKK